MKREDDFEINKELQLEYAMRCLENSPDGVFWTTRTGIIVYVNNAACNELGYTKKDLIGKHLKEIDANLAKEKLFKIEEFAEAGERGQVLRIETLHMHRDGHIIPVEISMGQLAADNNNLGFCFVRNMTEHKNAEKRLKAAYLNLEKNNVELNKLYNGIAAREEQLTHLAYHDKLTSLANRTLLMETLKLKTTEKQPNKFAVLFIDLDNFKNINDSLGHTIGDNILIEVSKRFQDCIRNVDAIYRFGGDEFIILLQDIQSFAEIQFISYKIKNSLLVPFRSNVITLYLTCSIGVSIFPDDTCSSEELLMYADAAMYKAKLDGKNHVRFFNFEMKKEVIHKIDFQNKLQNALKNNEFMLNYQPQFNMKTGGIRGLESLIRWNNPSLGIIGPNDFIPILEETGFIIPVGKWVLMQACSDANKWSKLYGFNGFVSVNISARQIKNDDFVRTVREAITITGMNPKLLELEITESLFIDSYESAISKLLELKELGVRICLDDFGQGFSSLGYLLQLPIDILKIDKSFIQEIEINSKKKLITDSILSLVNALGKETITEGIETIEQFEYMNKTKTNYLQGYLFSKPVPKETVPFILSENNRGVLFNGKIENIRSY